MKNKIKFKYPFQKLYGQTTATLLDVETVTKKMLDADMLAMDIQYYTMVEHKGLGPQMECHQATIPNGLLLCLTFKGNKRIAFTTLRRAKGKSFEKYSSQRKQEFAIIVDELEAPPVEKEKENDLQV